MIRVSTSNMYLLSDQAINADQSAMMTTEAELASGKQVNSPSDNPVGDAEATLLQSNVTQLSQYSSNQSQATQLLNNASSTVTQALNVLQSVNSSLVEAGNGTLTSSDKSALVSQLQQDLDQLVGLANTSDNEGGYLFSGSEESTAPFVQNGTTVKYVGDEIVPSVQISQTRSEQIKYSGSSVFMQVPTGNGTFVTGAASGNTGTGAISEGSVVTPSALTGDSYTITMNAADTGYTVVNQATNATVTSGSYSDPTTISFDGLQVQLSGQPAAGDSFTVAPAGTQSVFSVLAGAIAALQMPTATQAEQTQATAALGDAVNGVSQSITSLSTTQAAMGAQLSELSTYGTVNSDQNLQDETQISSIVDLDYAKGVSQLSQQQTQYQAALQSYASISKLSLFSYI